MTLLALGSLIGSAALALWAHVRLGGRAPRDWPIVFVHLGASLFVMYVAVPHGMLALLEVGSTAAGVAAVVAVAVPGLTYLFLASLWVVALTGRLLLRHLP
jgi:hypothetical protein